jgi:hypothetical protein
LPDQCGDVRYGAPDILTTQHTSDLGEVQVVSAETKAIAPEVGSFMARDSTSHRR